MRLCIIGSISTTTTDVVQTAIAELKLKPVISEIVIPGGTGTNIPEQALTYAKDARLPFRVFNVSAIGHLPMYRYCEKILAIFMEDTPLETIDENYKTLKPQFEDKIIEYVIVDTAEDQGTDEENVDTDPDLTVVSDEDTVPADAESYEPTSYTQEQIAELIAESGSPSTSTETPESTDTTSAG